MGEFGEWCRWAGGLAWEELRRRWLVYAAVAALAGAAGAGVTGLATTSGPPVLAALERIEDRLAALEAGVALESTLNDCLDSAFDRPCVPRGDKPMEE